MSVLCAPLSAVPSLDDQALWRRFHDRASHEITTERVTAAQSDEG
jgi:hypothetical protein